MVDITNANIEKMYGLNGLHEVVVQKGNVGKTYNYALQLLKQGTDAVVYRARHGRDFVKGKGKNSNVERLYLDGIHSVPANKTLQAAGGHTQTWEYANRTDSYSGASECFIGTKPKKDPDHPSIYWDTQIARVKFSKAEYKFNTQLPRISNLNQAGRKFGLAYSGNDLVRSEAAVSPSPNYSYFLIVTVDKSDTGYFSLYNLEDVNNALDRVGTGDVNLKTDALADQCLKAFKIKGLVKEITSLQGYDIDDNLNIYISSEAHPDQTDIYSKPRKIVKIPWEATEASEWDIIRLDNSFKLNESGYATEFEGIQVNSENDLYLTVAYHDSSDYTTRKNKIFKINW